MEKRWVGLLVILVLFWGSTVYGENLPLSLLAMHKGLTEHGYTLNKQLSDTFPDVLVYTKWKSVVTLGLDSANQVRSGSVLFTPECNGDAGFALGLIYFTLQVRMEKDLPKGKSLTNKIKYLVDTIIHNINLSDKTEFPYDDIVVTAEKLMDQSMTVRLRLRGW